MGWFDRKPKQEEVLKPGECECNHPRCAHLEGKGRCCCQYAPHTEDNETDGWQSCACQVFIPKKDDGDDDPTDVPIDPEVAELEKIHKL